MDFQEVLGIKWSQLKMPLHNNYRSPRIDPSTQGL